MKPLKLILTALALPELIFGDSKTTTLSREQVEKLKAAFKEKTGQTLALTDLTFDAEGYTEFSRTSLESIEDFMAEFETSPSSPSASANGNDDAIAAAIQSARTTRTANMESRTAQLETDLATERQNLAAANRTIETLGRQLEPIPAAATPVPATYSHIQRYENGRRTGSRCPQRTCRKH